MSDEKTDNKTSGELPKALSGSNVNEALDALMMSRVHEDTRMQCKVCWFIYDPEDGSPEWDIPPGTPFADLPDTWSCPDCGHPKASFLPADDDINFD